MNKPIQKKNHNILVFDSGVGGLSLVKHIRKHLPDITITYLADNAMFPYGLLEEQNLIDRVVRLVCRVSQQFSTDLIVIGCNSASTLVLPKLREKLAIPVVGVVPAIKPAAQLSQNKVIALLATPGTINREYTDALINNFNNGCEVIRCGSSELVKLVEQKFRGITPNEQSYQNILNPLKKHKSWNLLDTVVLACTHFPLASQELSRAAPEITHWIDSGEAIVRQVERVLTNIPPQKTMPPTKSKNIALFTQINSINNTFKKNLQPFGFYTIQQWVESPY